MYGAEELIVSPMWQESEPVLSSPFSYDSGASLLREGQSRVLRASGPGTVAVNSSVPVLPAQTYYLTAEVHNIGGSPGSYGLAVQDSAGAEIAYLPVSIPAITTINWTRYAALVTIPTGAAFAVPQIRSDAGANFYVAWVSMRLVDETTSPHGYQAQLTDLLASSLRVGTLEATAVSIDSTGKISADKISATTSLAYQGTELCDLLDGRARGVVVRVNDNRFRPTTGNISVETDLVEVQFTTPPDVKREYRIYCDTFGIGASSRETNFVLRHTTNGSAVTNSSTEILRDLVEPATYHRTKTFGREYSWEPGTTVRLRASIALGGGGSGNVQWNRYVGTTLSVVDEGPAVDRVGGYSEVSTPVLVTRTSSETTRKWDQSYKGDGTQYTYDSSKNYQGQYLSSNGILKSAIGAPDQMFTDLSGATVNWIKVYLYADHWYSNAGGQARIGVHASATKPATFPGVTNDLAVDFAHDQGKWITLPTTWYSSFKSGAYRGITLHAANSTATTYYGYFTAASTKWQWNYTK